METDNKIENQELFEEIKELVSKYFDVGMDINMNNSFYEYGINSITFIKIVVDIEEKYSFEFDEDNLNIENYESIYDLFLYVMKKSRRD